jgi:adenosine kinase
MKIVLTGSIAYDYIMTFPGYFKDHLIPDKLEKVSLSFLVDTMTRQRGGNAPNVAYTLALLGERPIILATVGKDFEDYRCWLDQNGIETKYIKVIPEEYTASFFVNTDKSNAQIASFYTGAMAHASKLSLKDLDFKPDIVVISPNDPEAMAKLVRECQELGISYLYDPSQQLARISAESICKGVLGAYSLFVNEYEYELLQKHTGMKPDEMIETVEYIVVTLGEQGAKIYQKNQEFIIPVVPPNSIADPTGVGDAFRGGFLKGLCCGETLDTCGKMGALAATFCLEQNGTQNHSYKITEFVERYRSTFHEPNALNSLLSN